MMSNPSFQSRKIGDLPTIADELDIAIYFGNCSPVEFDERTRQTIAAAIRERRALLGLSQEEAAGRSGGMISTANLRVFEGAGRPSFRPKSLIGVARAMGWPDDAIARIAAGDDPASFAELETNSDLATAQQVEGLHRELAAQRRAIAELGRRVEELASGIGLEPDVRRAAHSGVPADGEADGPRAATRARIEGFDPDRDPGAV